MPEQDDEYRKVMKILRDNEELSWVRRILEPDNYPVIDATDEEGRPAVMTHMMRAEISHDSQGREHYIVFPEILYDGEKLTDYGDEAQSIAERTGNFIEFDNMDDALWFSQKYKRAWGQ